MAGCWYWRSGSSSRMTACQSRPAVAVEGPDALIGPAADLRWRGQHVAACGPEVQVLGGQVAVALGRAGEVGVQAAAGGADVAAGALQQPGGAEPGEGAEPVAGGAVLVDVEDVGSGGAGGDGQVPAALAAEPFGDPLVVGGGVEVAVLGGRDLLAGQAGEDGPAALGVVPGPGGGPGWSWHRSGCIRGPGCGRSRWFRSSAGRRERAGCGPGIRPGPRAGWCCGRAGGTAPATAGWRCPARTGTGRGPASRGRGWRPGGRSRAGTPGRPRPAARRSLACVLRG